MSRERRGFARLYVGVEAIYKQKGNGVKENKVLVQDISLSGVRFIAGEALQKGTELAFTLNIPDIKVPIEASGRVIWQKKFSESFFDTGIEFINLQEKGREALRGYIERALGRVEEHRELVRSNLSTMVNYRLLSNPYVENRCISVDISPTGLKVFMKAAIKAGERMLLSFNLPDENELINAEGEIIWSKAREEKFLEAGIEFTSIEEKDITRINNYVKKTLGIDW